MRQFRTNQIVSQAVGKGGERVEKNVYAGVRGDDDFWNLEGLTPMAFSTLEVSRDEF